MIKLFFSFFIAVVLMSCGQAQPSDTPPPQVPTGYLYRITTGTPGQMMYVCGQRPFDAKGDLVGPGNLGLQTRQVFENLKTSLQTVDMTLRNVIQVTYSVKGASVRVDSSKIQTLNTLSATYFTTMPNIVEMKGVSLLGYDDVLIEIEVIAAK